MAAPPAYRYRTWQVAAHRYWLLLGGLAATLGLGLLAWRQMAEVGHWLTGMHNAVAWGLPHVFAVLLIVAASGALNLASIVSVFGRTGYASLVRFSALLAPALLIGGLLILVADLGRPERLLLIMAHPQPRSVFAWNVLLYNGFVALAIVYLWVTINPRGTGLRRPVALLALLWRLALTSATGLVFGLLAARLAYDSALLAPLFIALSFAWGLAVCILLLLGARVLDGQTNAAELLTRLARLLGLFVSAGLYFVLLDHLTRLYGTQHAAFEHWLLLHGGQYTLLFWIGQVGLGSLVPLGLLYHPRLSGRAHWLATASALIILGAFATLYVLIIGGQAVALPLFPDATVLLDGPNDPAALFGQVAPYVPRWPEWLLGFGGVAAALAICALGLRLLPVLAEPASAEDERGTQP